MSRFTPSEGWKKYFCKWTTGERTKEIIVAFHATNMAVRTLLAQYEKNGMTLIEAAHVADYLRGQQELIDQMAGRKQAESAQLMNSICQKLRLRFLALVQQKGLPVNILKERCRTGSGPAALEE